MFQQVGVLALQRIDIEAVLATAYLGNGEVALAVGRSPEDVALALCIDVLAGFSEDDLQTGRSEAVGHLNAPRHRGTLGVVQVVAEPAERPLLLLRGGLLTGIGYHLLARAFVEVHEEGAIQLTVALDIFLMDAAEVLALEHLQHQRRLGVGMYGKLLFQRSAVDILRCNGDSPYTYMVGHHTMEMVISNIVGPVVFGIYLTTGQAEGSILYHCSTLYSLHRSHGGKLALHLVVDIAIGELVTI